MGVFIDVYIRVVWFDTKLNEKYNFFNFKLVVILRFLTTNLNYFKIKVKLN